MKTAIITGASSGIGLAIVQILISKDYRVYGIARDYTSTAFEHMNFFKIPCDITDIQALQKLIKSLLDKENSVDILVNNAGIGLFGPHEQIKPEELERMVSTNLTAPLVLTGLLLRSLKKSSGTVINISSVTADKASTYGCAYAATKAGLSHFGESLFEEVRKTGIRVVTIQPDITATDFYDELDFTFSQEEGASISPDIVAQTVAAILEMPEGTVVTELTMRPRYNRIIRKSPEKTGL